PIHMNPGCFSDIFECAVALIVIERDAAVEAEGEIGLPVVVVVTDGASHSAAMNFEFRCLGDIDKFALAGVSEKPGVALAIGVDEENVGLAVAIEIEDARAAAKKTRKWFRCGYRSRAAFRAFGL